MKSTTVLTAACALVLTTTAARALVNPLLQPIHLYDRYKVVLAATVVSAELTDEGEDVDPSRFHNTVATFSPRPFSYCLLSPSPSPSPEVSGHSPASATPSRRRDA